MGSHTIGTLLDLRKPVNELRSILSEHLSPCRFVNSTYTRALLLSILTASAALVGCTESSTKHDLPLLHIPPETVDQLVRESLFQAPFTRFKGDSCLSELDAGLEHDSEPVEHNISPGDSLPVGAIAALRGKPEADKYTSIVLSNTRVYLFGRVMDSSGLWTTDVYAAEILLLGDQPVWNLVWQAHEFEC